MRRVFIGYDRRQPVAFHVCAHSILRRARRPVSITPLCRHALPDVGMGLTEFSRTRYLVPWLCGYEGAALFLDADMLVLADVSRLFDEFETARAAWGSRRPGKTPPHVAVVPKGEDTAFEMTAMMMLECSGLRHWTPDTVRDDGALATALIGTGEILTLRPTWHHLVGYEPPPQEIAPSILHFTQGIPIHPETRGHPFNDLWRDEHAHMLSSVDWDGMMGGSVHATEHKGERMSKLTAAFLAEQAA